MICRGVVPSPRLALGETREKKSEPLHTLHTRQKTRQGHTWAKAQPQPLIPICQIACMAPLLELHTRK